MGTNSTNGVRLFRVTALLTTPRVAEGTTLWVETTALDDVRHLIPFLDTHTPLLWIRKGNGMAGIGESLRLTFQGPNRLHEAADAWRTVVSSAHIHDDVQLPGTGLVAFGTFAFADESSVSSTLIVPRLILGRRDGQCWITRISVADENGKPHDTAQSCDAAGRPKPTPLGDEYRLRFLPGSLGTDDFRAAVTTAIERIRSGELSKVVLARDLVSHLPSESDVRRALVELVLGYPDCWTFAVDGLMGSSPETLVKVHHGTVNARVLAGTASRGRDAANDREASLALATSAKDLTEHRLAVTSVLDALSKHSPDLAASEVPFTLKLPNLWHLATDVSGTLSDRSSCLDLVAELHPTAAVAGTPQDTALEVIRELETFDRGRYAGPVGWVDSSGDGEWAVALRCAQLESSGNLTAYAGAGIVADSEPGREVLETSMKFRPITEAFG